MDVTLFVVILVRVLFPNTKCFNNLATQSQSCIQVDHLMNTVFVSKTAVTLFVETRDTKCVRLTNSKVKCVSLSLMFASSRLLFRYINFDETFLSKLDREEHLSTVFMQRGVDRHLSNPSYFTNENTFDRN